MKILSSFKNFQVFNGNCINILLAFDSSLKIVLPSVSYTNLSPTIHTALVNEDFYLVYYLFLDIISFI